MRELMLQRIALRPTADRILAVDDELNRFIQSRPVLWIALFDVQAKQEFSRLRGSRIVERRIAPVVLELFQTPAVLADGVVPFLQGTVSREIDDVVPSSGWVLSPNQRTRDFLRSLVVVLVAGRVVGVEK